MKSANAPEVIVAMKHVIGWECLYRFPQTKPGILTLARAMASMCPVEKFEWLSEKVISGASQCPTPLELRRICTTGKDGIRPLDGLETEDVDVTARMRGEG